MQKYFFPKTIVNGTDAFDSLSSLAGSRIGIVTDKRVMEKTGTLNKLVSHLGSKKFEILANVDHEPTFDLVFDNIDAAKEFKPDTLIALGGGSVIDVTKGLGVLLNHADGRIDRSTGGISYGRGRKAIDAFIAIPTTSGTGSEVTPFAVITDEKVNVKRVLIDGELMPDVAILDPSIPASMPPAITADTGFDALTHAVESYVCTGSNAVTAPYALQATKMVMDNLETCFKDPTNIKAREQLHLAASLAGLAIANSAAGLAHRMDQIGPIFKLSHGRSLAIVFPYVMQYNMKSCAAGYAELAKYLGLKGDSTKALAEQLITRIVQLRETLKIPASLKAAGIREQDLTNVVDDLSKEAVAGLSANFNPRKLTPEDVKKVFYSSYHGTPVTF